MPGSGDPDAAVMLANVPYFEGIDEKTRRAVAKEGKLLSYDAGKMIVGEGGSGVGFYLVIDGKVQVRKGSKVLATLEKGQFFGEMSVIDGAPRSADVVALAPTKCWVLSAWSFSGLVKAHPELAMSMLKELVKRLRATQTVPAS
ncbi:MAG: cyclic nucleotide-binding domain-containing protein [Thaumarchaeota archaeon]|nr:cyclic nucleotide-binding domain-containing protein [Nitrososphaerota archaeon]